MFLAAGVIGSAPGRLESDMMEQRRMKYTRPLSAYNTQTSRLATTSICNQLNAKLLSGRSPLHETGNGCNYTLLLDLCTEFIAASCIISLSNAIEHFTAEQQ